MTDTTNHVVRTYKEGIVEVTIDGATHRIAWDDYSDPDNSIGWTIDRDCCWEPIGGNVARDPDNSISEDATDAELIELVSAEVSATPCECGRWSGSGCAHHDGPRVQIAYIPECLQDSTVAAGTKHGCWTTIMVHPDCAAEMLELDPEWVEVLQ